MLSTRILASDVLLVLLITRYSKLHGERKLSVWNVLEESTKVINAMVAVKATISLNFLHLSHSFCLP
jgi:hypothetical protein